MTTSTGGNRFFFYYYYSAYTRGTSLCFLSAVFLVRNRQTSLHGHKKTPASWVGSQYRRYYIIVYGGLTKLLLKRAKILPWPIDRELVFCSINMKSENIFKNTTNYIRRMEF